MAQVQLPDPQQAAEAAAIEATVPAVAPFRPAVAITWSLGLAILGGAVWAALTFITEYQLGLVAIVIGLLAGYGAARGGRSRQAQWVGAVCAGLGYFIGQLIVVVALILTGRAGAADATTAEPAAEESVQDGASVAPSEAGEAAESPAAAAGDANPPDAATEPSAAASDMGFWQVLALLMWTIISSTFTSFDVVFLAIAVWEGYALPRPR